MYLTDSFFLRICVPGMCGVTKSKGNQNKIQMTPSKKWCRHFFSISAAFALVLTKSQSYVDLYVLVFDYSLKVKRHGFDLSSSIITCHKLPEWNFIALCCWFIWPPWLQALCLRVGDNGRLEPPLDLAQCHEALAVFLGRAALLTDISEPVRNFFMSKIFILVHNLLPRARGSSRCDSGEWQAMVLGDNTRMITGSGGQPDIG